jgi:hypothetical protein
LQVFVSLGTKPRSCPNIGLGRPAAQIGIVGDLQGAAARAFGQAAFGQRLDAPSDPPEKELLVARPRLLAEHLQVLLLELADGHPGQIVNLFLNRCFHDFLLSQGR